MFLGVKLGLAFGQQFVYPTIKQEAQSITDFIPHGWVILDSASGDLDGDQIKDYAVIIQTRDSVPISKTEDGITDTVITHPRILFILFRNTSTNSYQLAEQSNSFILNWDNPQADEPFQSIEIKKRVLQIDFQLFYTAGSWWITNTSYRFRYQGNAFVLIGADNNSLHRATHEHVDYSYNFLSNKYRVDQGNNDAKQRRKIEWHRLDLKELPTLRTLKQPYTWEIVKDIYL